MPQSDFTGISNKEGTVALEIDANGRALTDPNISEFARILAKQFKDTEEVKYDIPASLVSASIYVGVAPDGTATNSAAWKIVRYYFDANGLPSRQRYRADKQWDLRADATHMGW